jgi:hypothetical protein
MHPEVEKFITGHGGSDDPDVIAKVSLYYGDAWIRITLQMAIEKYPATRSRRWTPRTDRGRRPPPDGRRRGGTRGAQHEDRLSLHL